MIVAGHCGVRGEEALAIDEPTVPEPRAFDDGGLPRVGLLREREVEPAYASLSFEKKLESWLRLRAYL